MTSSDVADFLKIQVNSVRRWSRTGKLKGYRLGDRGDWRYLRGDVLAFLKRNKVLPKEVVDVGTK
ncbi:MAG TPA: helix-turn-helix domain-containing protein [Dehalococcoidia bacterium]|nr:helix-turn-helix domain-containing protein [Dehalococcoidia bacterium]